MGNTIQQETLTKIRARETFVAILEELRDRREQLKLDTAVIQELNQYLQVQSLLPSILTSDNRKEVNKAQEALFTLQGRLDRVASIHLTTRKIIRALNRLEILAKSDLLAAGILTDKTSKPSAEQTTMLMIPELFVVLNEWDFLERLCRDVQDHIGNAKESLTLQMKLDGNHWWAQRNGA